MIVSGWDLAPGALCVSCHEKDGEGDGGDDLRRRHRRSRERSCQHSSSWKPRPLPRA